MSAYSKLTATRRLWRERHPIRPMHHSPSSHATASACERKWWYEHVERRREPDVTWEEIEAAGDQWQQHFTPKQRSSARGIAVHALLEEYYLGGTPDWTSYIGQIALSGRAHLPHREACLEIRVERSIGDDPYPSDDQPDRTSLSIDGVRHLGYVDLEVRLDPSGAEARRLGIAPALLAGNGWYTFDYKTSKDVDQWALTPEAAATDAQGIIYSTAGMLRTKTPARGMRWVYMQTEKRSYAKPVDALFTYEGNRAHLTVLAERGRRLEQITDIEQAPMNPDACQDYGGCPHHESRGGPCKARRSLGRMLKMGFRDEYLAQKAGVAPTNAAPPSTPPAAETPAQTATTIAPPKRGFGKKAPTPAAEPTPAAPTEAPAGANGPPAPVVKVTQVISVPESQNPNLGAELDTPHDGGKSKRVRATSKKTLAELMGDLEEAVCAEFACSKLAAWQLIGTLVDIHADALRDRG